MGKGGFQVCIVFFSTLNSTTIQHILCQEAHLSTHFDFSILGRENLLILSLGSGHDLIFPDALD